MTTGAVNFDKKPVTKFGVQVDKPRKITVFRSGDKFDTGKEILIKNFRTLQQLETKVAKEVNLMPALNGIYTVQGKRIRSLDDFVDKESYVAVRTGAKFNPEKLSKSLTPTNSAPSTPNKAPEIL